MGMVPRVVSVLRRLFHLASGPLKYYHFFMRCVIQKHQGVSLNLGAFVYSFIQPTVSEAAPLSGPMLGSGEAHSAGHS